jgi:hypothetical protein
VIVAREVEVQSVVGLAFAGEDGAVGGQGVFKGGDLEGLPEQVAVAMG